MDPTNGNYTKKVPQKWPASSTGWPLYFIPFQRGGSKNVRPVASRVSVGPERQGFVDVSLRSKKSRARSFLHPGLGWTVTSTGFRRWGKELESTNEKIKGLSPPKKRHKKKKHSLKLLGFVEGRLIGGGCGSLKG